MFTKAPISSLRFATSRVIPRPPIRCYIHSSVRGNFSRNMATSLPSKISGVSIDKTGGREVLQYKTDLPLPELQDGEILIKNAFIGINYIDTYFRSGLYPIPSFPHILGREGSGTVVAISSSNPLNLSIGDRVAYMGTGAYATYTAAHNSKVLKVPEGISLEDAAASPLQALTAWTMIHQAYEVKKGDTVLITAAAGGVGLWLVQMAKAKGATVIATTSAHKVQAVRDAGADHVIDYSTDEDFVPHVREITKGEGVHVVFDGIGKSTFDRSLVSVRRNGTFVSFGNASGAVPPFNILRLSDKNVKLVRPTLNNYLGTREEVNENAKAVWDFILSGQIKVAIHEIYPLKDVARAHEDLEGRKTTGKLLLKP